MFEELIDKIERISISYQISKFLNIFLILSYVVLFLIMYSSDFDYLLINILIYFSVLTFILFMSIIIFLNTKLERKINFNLYNSYTYLIKDANVKCADTIIEFLKNNKIRDLENLNKMREEFKNIYLHETKIHNKNYNYLTFGTILATCIACYNETIKMVDIHKLTNCIFWALVIFIVLSLLIF